MGISRNWTLRNMEVFPLFILLIFILRWFIIHSAYLQPWQTPGLELGRA